MVVPTNVSSLRSPQVQADRGPNFLFIEAKGPDRKLSWTCLSSLLNIPLHLLQEINLVVDETKGRMCKEEYVFPQVVPLSIIPTLMYQVPLCPINIGIWNAHNIHKS
jgi:hypothetical protein